MQPRYSDEGKFNPQYYKDWYQKNKDSRRVYNRMRKFGISEDQFRLMFDEQQGKCKICSTELDASSRTTHVDHCHNSQKIRGLLCQSCNSMIGFAKDNVETLKQAIAYLEGNR